MTKTILLPVAFAAALIVAATAQSPAPAPVHKMPTQMHLSAQNNSDSGPSSGVAKTARVATLALDTVSSKRRKRWMASQGLVKAPGSST